MQIRAFISCVFILIQRSDWVGLDHLFLGSYVKSSHATVGEKKKKSASFKQPDSNSAM